MPRGDNTIRDQVAALALAGRTRVQIATALGIGETRVKAAMERARTAGLLPASARTGKPMKAWTTSDDRIVALAMRGGANCADAALLVDRPTGSVETRVRDFGGRALYMDEFAPIQPRKRTPAPPAAPVKLDCWGHEARRQSRRHMSDAEAQREGDAMRARFEARAAGRLPRPAGSAQVSQSSVAPHAPQHEEAPR